MDNIIAMTDWEACSTCIHLKENGGCEIPSINLSVYRGDWIVCDDYQAN